MSEGRATIGRTVEVTTTEPHTATVIFLHGLGQTTSAWLPSVESLADKFPDVKWILPQAPRRPVTLNGGQFRPSWFDIAALPPGRCEYDEETISQSITLVESTIIAEVHRGIDPRRILLTGFSQGAALSLMVALTTLHDLGGVATLSGWIPHRAREQMIHTEPNLPIFWGHGIADEEIPLLYARECLQFLRDTLNVSDDAITFITYEELAHATSEREFEDLAAWMTARLIQKEPEEPEEGG